MRGLIAQFIDHIAYERGLSSNTCSAYEADLLAFVAFLEGDCGAVPIGAVTREHIAAFLDAQRQRRMSVRTLARRLVALKVFFAYLFSEGLIRENVAEVMETPNKGRQLPRTLSESEIVRLLESVSGSSARDVRDRSMLELFYACGLRGPSRSRSGWATCDSRRASSAASARATNSGLCPIGGEARLRLNAMCRSRARLCERASG